MTVKEMEPVRSCVIPSHRLFFVSPWRVSGITQCFGNLNACGLHVVCFGVGCGEGAKLGKPHALQKLREAPRFGLGHGALDSYVIGHDVPLWFQALARGFLVVDFARFCNALPNRFALSG